jgi:proteasome lid subunit RPN8/RPN11
MTHHYQLPGASWRLQFSAEVVQIMERHVQNDRSSVESVGQLFAADLTISAVVVELATVLTPIRAGRSRVWFDTAGAMAQRAALFEQGWHFVGFWHTHPEPRPKPSAVDRSLARNHALAARPQLAGIVFAILGFSPWPEGLGLWLDDGEHLHVMQAQR